ncbi:MULTISPECIES: ScbR family autoregulator-binding transcription factor [unclassified Streptomyces]|uniref:ScbR family autoregulator-binding transcription factor n=1 Tax=Streptomycetaceae TaxID=2062 RepID=UPI002E763915|nr:MULTISPECIES: ScbR family autoregulator-binding transcription factor [unclassified Streptomyces]MED7951621.1 ScbR family autoregulator-binding transcription factor [Streptomyces sp. BE303]MEE1829042.1 ScbR family autoregulator-binding transcription factor [Streptomyces sp. BE20]
MAKQERAGRTRQAVLLAAADTFADAGFESASLVDISRRAGVSKGALYFHFVSKQALADGVRAEAGDAIGAAVLRALRGAAPAVQELIDLTHELGRLLREDVVVRAGVLLGLGGRPAACAGGLVVAPAGSPPEPSADAWRSLTAVFRTLLDRAGEAGELRPGLDRGQAAELLTTLAAGLVLFAAESTGRLAEEAVRGLWAAALPALVPAERFGEYRT